MSKHKIVAFKRVPVRGGIEVQAQGSSQRGTKFIADSRVVLTEGLSEKEIRDAVAAAVKDMYPKSE